MRWMASSSGAEANTRVRVSDFTRLAVKREPNWAPISPASSLQVYQWNQE